MLLELSVPPLTIAKLLCPASSSSPARVCAPCRLSQVTALAWMRGTRLTITTGTPCAAQMCAAREDSSAEEIRQPSTLYCSSASAVRSSIGPPPACSRISRTPRGAAWVTASCISSA